MEKCHTTAAFYGRRIIKKLGEKIGRSSKAIQAIAEPCRQEQGAESLAELHEQAFEAVDCLKCANCCKNYSPRFKTPDIKRISKHLKMKEGDFINSYLYIDGEGDYVLRSKPCPFLGADNFCSIYEVRPSDCRRFPYTDEDVLLKRQSLTIKNSSFCPIVYFVLEKLLEK